MTDNIVTLTSIEPDFCSQLVGRLMTTGLNTGSARPTVSQASDAPEWATSTAYGETFRGLIFDDMATGSVVPADLIDAARQISGLPDVVAFRAQANAMLAGQGLGRHTDVPEFWGARRYSFPDWLLVTMLHSGLYDDRQIRVISALVWPMDTNGGDLRVFDRHDRVLLASFPPVTGTAVVFDTCRLPHEVGTIPGHEVPAFMGDRIKMCRGQWQILHRDGSVETFPFDQVRTSILIKLACFADRGERKRWFGCLDEPLDPDTVLATLAQRFPVANGTGDPRQRLVDHIVPYR